MIHCAFRNGKAELGSGELRFTPPHAPPLRWDLSDLLPFFEEVEENFRIRNGFLILLQIPCVVLLGIFLTGLLFRSNSETLPGVFVAVLLTLLPEIYLAGRMKRKKRTVYLRNLCGEDVLALEGRGSQEEKQFLHTLRTELVQTNRFASFLEKSSDPHSPDFFLLLGKLRRRGILTEKEWEEEKKRHLPGKGS